MTLPRRRFLGWLGAAGLGAAAGAGAASLASSTDAEPATTTSLAEVVPFHGAHQAGIATPRQAHLQFASVDVAGASREDLRALLRFWTEAAARMTEGSPAVSSPVSPEHVPWDTGESAGLGPNRLTITLGVGPTLFTRDGIDRFGLAAERPDALVDLPAFSVDRLEPGLVGGDLCIQACADDEQVAFHAVRELLRLGHGLVAVRWTQGGFLPQVDPGVTPRNLLGFKDGTNNVGGHPDAFEEFVWVGEEGPAWLRGGSYLVARRIEILLDEWDGSSLGEQEAVIGRRKESGAPLSGRAEHDSVDLRALDAAGASVIPTNAHIRLAAADSNHGARILRRGYSFADRGEGALQAGLFFLAYQRDPRAQFIPIQRRLAREDALNEYVRHTGSGIFAVLPGVPAGGALGEGLV
jgi:deferrochelatase/peroxidase EfeB